MDEHPPASVRIANLEFGLEVLHLTHKGEDAHVVTDDYLAVVDGASASGQAHFSPSELAAFAAHRVGTVPARKLREAVTAMLTEFREMNDSPMSSHAAAVWARLRDDRIEIGSLADCVGVVSMRDGQVRTTNPSRRLASLDGQLARTIAHGVRSGRPLVEVRAELNERIRANRARWANQPDGYWVVGAEPDAARHLSLLKVVVTEIDSLLLCSDGFTRLISPFRAVPDPASLLRWAEQVGLARLGVVLRELEAAPDSVVAAPRTSIHDDVTALLLRRI